MLFDPIYLVIPGLWAAIFLMSLASYIIDRDVKSARWSILTFFFGWAWPVVALLAILYLPYYIWKHVVIQVFKDAEFDKLILEWKEKKIEKEKGQLSIPPDNE